MTNFDTPSPLPEPNDHILKDEIRREADFIIDKVLITAFNGESYDVNLIKEEINIYCDLFNNVVSGNITLKDANDLPTLLPIIGEEKLLLRFTRPNEKSSGRLEEEINMEFRIYKMSDRQLNNRDKCQIYTLHFASPELLTNLKTRVREAYKDKPYSEMVQLIYDEKIKSKKPLVIEEIKHLHYFVIPNLTPFEAISIFASRSQSAEGNGSSYVFYEDHRQFNFVSIGKLLDQESKQSYVYQLGNVLKHEDSLVRDRNIEQDIVRVEKYAFSGTFDIVANLTRGMYASKLLTYDPVRKIFETNEFDYVDSFEELPHTDKTKICTDSLDVLKAPDAHQKFMITNKDHDTIPWIAGKEPGILPHHTEDWALLRQSQMYQINNAKIGIKVSGDPRRSVGDIINFQLPNASGALNEDHPPDPQHDKYMSGKYLVIAIRHQLNRTKYYMHLEIVKDSIVAGIEHINPNSEQAAGWTL